MSISSGLAPESKRKWGKIIGRGSTFGKIRLERICNRRHAMATQLEALGLDKLTVQQRLELIETLWDSLPEQLDPNDVPDWHLAELAKRRAATISNPGVGKPWREVLDRLEATP
jgi:putative addiction module component (TIGR02574 family)